MLLYILQNTSQYLLKKLNKQYFLKQSCSCTIKLALVFFFVLIQEKLQNHTQNKTDWHQKKRKTQNSFQLFINVNL